MILGILGALIGSWLYTAVSGNEDTSGIDWIALIIGVIVAAVLVASAVMPTARARLTIRRNGLVPRTASACRIRVAGPVHVSSAPEPRA